MRAPVSGSCKSWRDESDSGKIKICKKTFRTFISHTLLSHKSCIIQVSTAVVNGGRGNSNYRDWIKRPDRINNGGNSAEFSANWLFANTNFVTLPRGWSLTFMPCFSVDSPFPAPRVIFRAGHREQRKWQQWGVYWHKWGSQHSWVTEDKQPRRASEQVKNHPGAVSQSQW